MAYRGGDLDLRTPRTWSAGAAEPPSADLQPRGRANYANGPIWVDEVVLACVNHAFDVALAHRAGEVRLEHLLHALTRIDTAAEALEARGIRVAALRRESATVIASEIPVGLSNGKSAPPRSEELEHVLRAASLIASRRNGPANVDDVLHLLLDVEPDLPGLVLLARVAPRVMQQQAEPYYARSGYGSEPRFDTRPATGYAASSGRETSMPQPAPQRPQRNELSSSPVDNIQNSRLDALEQMVRALSSDISNERTSFSSMLQGLQRDVGAQRDEAERTSAAISGLRLPSLDLSPVLDRISSIDRAVSAQFEQFSSALSTLENEVRRNAGGNVDLSSIGGRLDIIEEAVLARDTERALTQLTQRLATLEDTLAADRTRNAESGAALRGELGLLTQALDQQRADLGAVVVSPLAARFDELVSGLTSRHAEAVDELRLMTERVATAERLLGEYHLKADAAQTAGREELAEVHEALTKLNANQHTLANVLEQWKLENRQVSDVLLGEMRKGNESVASEVKALTPQVVSYATKFASLEVEAQRLSGMVDGLSGSVEKMHRVTVERYYRRNRFWYWLFGTDDWVAASWPSQAQRITEELLAVKAAPARRS